jgi:hypothetical protein
MLADVWAVGDVVYPAKRLSLHEAERRIATAEDP